MPVNRHISWCAIWRLRYFHFFLKSLILLLLVAISLNPTTVFIIVRKNAVVIFL